MDQFEEKLLAYKQPAIAVAGGIGCAIVMATLPHVYFESLVGLTGLSAILPAAAPPLGGTARALITISAGLATSVVAFAFLSHKSGQGFLTSVKSLVPQRAQKGQQPAQKRDRKKGFPVPKISIPRFSDADDIADGADDIRSLEDLPKLRVADSHPDAPPRKPISAHADLGDPMGPVDDNAYTASFNLPDPVVAEQDTDNSYSAADHRSTDYNEDSGMPSPLPRHSHEHSAPSSAPMPLTVMGAAFRSDIAPAPHREENLSAAHYMPQHMPQAAPALHSIDFTNGDLSNVERIEDPAPAPAYPPRNRIVSVDQYAEIEGAPMRADARPDVSNEPQQERRAMPRGLDMDDPLGLKASRELAGRPEPAGITQPLSIDELLAKRNSPATYLNPTEREELAKRQAKAEELIARLSTKPAEANAMPAEVSLNDISRDAPMRDFAGPDSLESEVSMENAPSVADAHPDVESYDLSAWMRKDEPIPAPEPEHFGLQTSEEPPHVSQPVSVAEEPVAAETAVPSAIEDADHNTPAKDDSLSPAPKKADLTILSVTQLIDRLAERLNRLDELAIVAAKATATQAAPMEQQPVAVEQIVNAAPTLRSVETWPTPAASPAAAEPSAKMDDALRRALGTLDRMAARGGR